MRSFQLFFLILFIAFYAFITFGSVSTLSKLVKASNRRKLTSAILFFSALVILGFVGLYVWPMSASKAGEYSIYLVFNALLSFDFIVKIALTLAFLSSFFLRDTKQKAVIANIGFIVALAMGSSVVYGSLFGRNKLVVNKVELGFENLPAQFDDFRLVHISDIHLGSFISSRSVMEQVEKKTAAIQPDLVLFTGDLVNNFSSELDGWSTMFTSISKPGRSFSILGNHDYGNYSKWDSEAAKEENFREIVSAHERFGFQLLRNENALIKMGGDSIFIIGVENWGHPPFPQYANLEKAMHGVPPGTFNLLLSHDPSHWNSIVKENPAIDLTLSGHTHGMQVGIKKAGVLFSLSYFIRENWAGLYRHGQSLLYVNTGLGTVGIPWRINMPAELTVITLKRVEVD